MRMKPCPNCGDTSIIINHHPDGRTFSVECTVCGSKCFSNVSPSSAVQFWNTAHRAEHRPAAPEAVALAAHDMPHTAPHGATYQELDAANAKLGAECDELRAALRAAWRLHLKAYHDWRICGGPNECKHGIAAGIPCERCDDETLRKAIHKIEGRVSIETGPAMIGEPRQTPYQAAKRCKK